MAPVSPRDAERTAGPDSKFRIFLFHGADAGLIHEKAKLAVLAHTPDISDPFAVTRLAGDSLFADPGRLADEVGALGLFAENRSVWVDATSLGTLPGLETLEQERMDSTRLVIEAGELRRDAPLRKIAEQSPHIACIECAVPTPSALRQLVEESLRREGLQADPEVTAALAAILPADWISSRSELDKLCLYAAGRGAIGPADVAALVTDAERVDPDDVADAASSGDFNTLQRAWDRARETGQDGGVILGFALRRLLFRRPGQSRALDEMAPDLVRGLVRTLADAVRDGRREPRLANAISLRALWTLANRARRAG
jgi:DNA polymerase III subunit delta